MVRTLLTVKKQIKLSLNDIKVKPNPHNHNEVQVFIKDEFVGYGSNVSELIRDSKISYKDKHLADSKGVFKIDVIGPTIHDISEGGLLILPYEEAYLLDIDIQKRLGINSGLFNLSPFSKELLFILLIVASGFCGIYYRDVIAVENNHIDESKNIPVK